MTNEEYGRYVDALAPRSKTGKNLLNAFWVVAILTIIAGLCAPAAREPARRS